MFYTEVTFTITPYSEDIAEIIMAALGESGFNSFTYTDTGFKAYIPSSDFQEDSISTLEVLDLFSGQYSFKWEVAEIENQDWNRIWEENFTPITVDNRIMVRAGFHPENKEVEYDIIIDPKMSFGTGHHATTALMLETILDLKPEIKGKRVLDMGCGTGILAIMASKAGAFRITGIDIDEWAYHNAWENLRSNNIENVEILIGDAALLDGSQQFDIILANINRNILLDDMPAYNRVLSENALLIMSGFYQEDLPMIEKKAVELGLNQHSFRSTDNWCVAIFNK